MLPDTSPAPDFDGLWDFNDPVATRSRFMEVWGACGPDTAPDYRGQLCSQIARTYSLSREFAQCDAWCDAGEAECRSGEAVGQDVRCARVRLLLERGRRLNSSGDAPGSVTLFMQAMERANAGGFEALALDAIHMLAIVCPGEAGLAWTTDGLARAERSDDARAKYWLGPLTNNGGWRLHDLGRYAEALELFEKSQAIRESQDPTGDPARIARWCVARCLRSLGRYEAARTLQLSLRDSGLSRGAEDGFVYEELGELGLLLGQAADARASFARAYDLLGADPSFARVDSARLERIRVLGGLEP